MSFLNGFLRFRPGLSDSRGSFVVGAVIFLFFFMVVGTFGIDLSRYYMHQQRAQDIADRAVLAGGQALNQPTSEPDLAVVYQIVRNYIIENYGQQHADFYQVNSPTDVDNIRVVHYTTSDPDHYGQEYYRVGALVYGAFSPYFWPSRFFGEVGSRLFVRHAVAEVHPRPIRQFVGMNIDCSVYAAGNMNLSGNNFKAGGAAFCAGGNINAGGSNNGVIGDVYLHSSGSFSPPGGGHGTVNSYDEQRLVPRFTETNPAAYDVNLADFDEWAVTGQCPGNARAVRTQDSEAPDVQWEDGSPVCVVKTADGYSISNNNGGQISLVGGDPVTIYSDDSVTFSGNGNGLKGGLYARGSILVEGNNYLFEGDRDKLGGLALWGAEDLEAEAEAEVEFERNSIKVVGISGAGGDYIFGSMGGGTGPILEGLLVTGGNFIMPSNSDNARITFDTEIFDPSFIDFGNWQQSAQVEQTRPLYSEVKVRLIS